MSSGRYLLTKLFLSLKLLWVLQVVALSAEAAERAFLNFHECTWLSHTGLCIAYASYTAMSGCPNDEIVSIPGSNKKYRGKSIYLGRAGNILFTAQS
jgi:hypothetical protein